MAASPVWKIYNPQGEYIASCKHAEDAAALVALYSPGGVIRYRHRLVLWREGAESQPAAESYDFVGIVARNRLYQKRAAVILKDVHARQKQRAELALKDKPETAAGPGPEERLEAAERYFNVQ